MVISWKSLLPETLVLWLIWFCSEYVSKSAKKATEERRRRPEAGVCRCVYLMVWLSKEPRYFLLPIGVESLGSQGLEAKSLIAEISRPITHKCGDSRSGSILVQRRSVAIHRGNAARVG